MIWQAPEIWELVKAMNLFGCITAIISGIAFVWIAGGLPIILTTKNERIFIIWHGWLKSLFAGYCFSATLFFCCFYSVLALT